MPERDYVIAVDFDGTLESGGIYPAPGIPNHALIAKLKELQAIGVRLILYTCRENNDLDISLHWCAEQGLTFDAVNENPPDRIALHKNDCRKIGADLYIDDKAITPDKAIAFLSNLKSSI